jgi:uncharacterized damage-inducible protein DinB
MPTECDRIADQLFRIVEGDAWHGPPVDALVVDVAPDVAASRPIPGVHSIWELVLHMTTWAGIARRRLTGEIVEATPDEDWPPVREVTAGAWVDATQALDRAHADLRRAVLALGDGHLEDRTPGKPYPLYVLLHGVVQHTAYHAGQIAAIKRSVVAGSESARS